MAQEPNGPNQCDTHQCRDIRCHPGLVRLLDLSLNQLTGEFPDSFRFSYASKVVLTSNRFHGRLPVLSSNVTSLYLRDNLFQGPIPSDIGTKMPNLFYLDISGNFLNGTIPISLSNITSLGTLGVSGNQLSGNIPDIWDRIPNLYAIDMSNNSLSGQIPTSIGYLTSLYVLSLYRNNLDGEIPSRLRNCTSMYLLDLGDNRLSTTFPTWLGESMPALHILRLRNNSFEGPIDSKLCRLSSLHILDLSENRFSGAIPTCLGHMNGFRTKAVSGDFLATITSYPTEVVVVAKGSMLVYGSTLYLMNSLDLSRNELSGEIPENITSLFEMRTLNLSMNHLEGKIPSDIGSLKMLESLDLSRNNLTGPVPRSMVSLSFLNHLNLSYNDLSGEIPASNQLDSLNDPSIYEGNTELCGGPLNKVCRNQTSDRNGDKQDDEDDDEFETLVTFVVMAAGFISGFWAVCLPLIVKKHLRDAYFDFLLRMKNKVCKAFAFS